MAKELLPDALWARIAPLIPPEPPKPKGGRPRVSDRAALTGILFVLKTGIPWEYLPAEMGCGSGMTCWRRLRDWYQAGVWRRLHQVLVEELAHADRVDWDRAAVDSAVGRTSCMPTRITTIGTCGPGKAAHHPPHRSLRRRAQEPVGKIPLGGRTYPLLAQPLPTPEDPLRAPRRHPSGLPAAWLRAHLPAFPRLTGFVRRPTRENRRPYGRGLPVLY